MVMETPSPQCVGLEFVRQYYTVLNKAPEHLHRFYSNNSSFRHGRHSFSHGRHNDHYGPPIIGQHEIHKKILSLNFRNTHAKIRLVDAHATLANGVVIQVTGELSNGGLPLRRFMQTFVLAPQTPKKYYVHNDIFYYQDEVFSDEDSGAEGCSDGEEKVDTPGMVEPSALYHSPSPVPPTVNRTGPHVQEPEPQITAPHLRSQTQLMRKLEEILDNITAENVEMSSTTVKLLNINTKEKLMSLAELICKKAMGNQHLSPIYAQLCNNLSLLSVKCEDGSAIKLQTLVKNMCQERYESNFSHGNESLKGKNVLLKRNKRRKTDMHLQEAYLQHSIGNIRFIGELYKLRMLSSPIMMHVIGLLLKEREEIFLDFLYTLLKTVGRILETHCNVHAKSLAEFNRYFKKIDLLAKDEKVCHHTRTKMKEVIDLRTNNWVTKEDE